MKRHAAFFKNIAALIMLVGLLSLLLPFCKVTTPQATTTVSGMEVVKIGAGAGYEYYSNGTIDNDYVLKDSLTWGELKGEATYAKEHNQLVKIVVCVGIAMLPIIFCFLSMLLTFIARGKKTMLLPTLLIALTVLEDIVLLLGFFKFKTMFSDYAEITLLIGMFAFTALCAVAFAILMLLWITGGFNKPKQRSRFSDTNSKDDQDDDDDDDKKKKDRTSWRDRRREKRRKSSKKKKKKNKKRSKKSKRNKDKSNNTNQTNQYTENQAGQNQTNESNPEQNPDTSSTVGTAGHITGLTGMYEGANINLSNQGNNTFLIGTTPEAVNVIASKNMQDLDKLTGANCVVQYDAEKNLYTIKSHSQTGIYLQEDTMLDTTPVAVANGELKVVGPNTVLYIGDASNMIRLN